jgi:hypothetical protein
MRFVNWIKLFLAGFVIWGGWFLVYASAAKIGTREQTVLLLQFGLIAVIMSGIALYLFGRWTHLAARLLVLLALYFIWYVLWGLIGSQSANIAKVLDVLPVFGNAPIYLDDMVELKSYAAFAIPLFAASWIAVSGRLKQAANKSE